jgi:CO/xanthine dehydrogenase Mo-binding subunit
VEALGLIEVEYEVLSPVLHVLDAMKDEAPLLHEVGRHHPDLEVH